MTTTAVAAWPRPLWSLRPACKPETRRSRSNRLESRARRSRQLRTQAIVPIKSFSAAKQRLADALAAGSRPPLVQALLDGTGGEGVEVAVVPDRHGTGTNALVLAPPDAMRPSFGEGSFERHMAAARDADRNHRVEPVGSLAPDVDTPEDLAVVWNLVDDARMRAQRTRGALRQLDRSGARAALAGAPASRAIEG